MKKDIGIVIMSHGDFSKAMLSSAKLIVGELENVASIGVYHDSSIEELQSQLNLLVASLNCKRGLIILTDIIGGTPTKLATQFKYQQADTLVFTGVNLGMLLELVTSDVEIHEVSNLLALAHQSTFREITIEEEKENDYTL